jgi:hypothetical protein
LSSDIFFVEFLNLRLVRGLLYIGKFSRKRTWTANAHMNERLSRFSLLRKIEEIPARLLPREWLRGRSAEGEALSFEALGKIVDENYAMLLLDSKQKVVKFFGPVERELGVSPDSLLGRSATEFRLNFPWRLDDIARALKGEVVTRFRQTERGHFGSVCEPLGKGKGVLLITRALSSFASERAALWQLLFKEMSEPLLASIQSREDWAFVPRLLCRDLSDAAAICIRDPLHHGCVFFASSRDPELDPSFGEFFRRLCAELPELALGDGTELLFLENVNRLSFPSLSSFPDLADRLESFGFSSCMRLSLSSADALWGGVWMFSGPKSGRDLGPVDRDFATLLGVWLASAVQSRASMERMRRAHKTREESWSHSLSDFQRFLHVAETRLEALSDRTESQGLAAELEQLKKTLYATEFELNGIHGQKSRSSQALQLEAIGVEELAQRMREAGLAMLHEKGMQLEVHVSSGKSLVLCDRLRLLQIARVLISIFATRAPSGALVSIESSSSSRSRMVSFHICCKPALAQKPELLCAELDWAASKEVLEAHGGELLAGYSPRWGTYMDLKLPKISRWDS